MSSLLLGGDEENRPPCCREGYEVKVVLKVNVPVANVADFRSFLRRDNDINTGRFNYSVGYKNHCIGKFSWF